MCLPPKITCFCAAVSEVPDAPLPPHWSAMSPNDLFDEISLRKDSDEYKRTEQLFRTQYRQPGCTIEKVRKSSSDMSFL